ncbi:class IIb bacteriocin, lactobin A/cerein 7B family [candidate division KSB3 bacterium]|uniref:Class IIb bacteriocin, lactobin A/cerein 7B family n=1 Tax=candidate division KSB3 bacterium TaxID=2044937 RepID=A0A9D5JZ85_9BACT|nr:class IIb bacteriocin, lactobin A/cerein 7B family [candidate division KSB3 bacterium]MBD3326750.1 class IIb bacteriocin, lactobin A/cerein 7B family [candidate division KSB3 bacterium]
MKALAEETPAVDELDEEQLERVAGGILTATAGAAIVAGVSAGAAVVGAAAAAGGAAAGGAAAATAVTDNVRRGW